MRSGWLININRAVALLITWSAILLCSCSSSKDGDVVDKERLITQQTDSMVTLDSDKGGKSRRTSATLMERYELAAEPYTEFRKGVDVITYDSLETVNATLVANYAILLEKQKLWEARGNVVVVNSTRDTLETQQLFWDQKLKKIYSNVDTRITLASGDIQIGTSFESDEEFKEWVFRESIGRSMFEANEEEADSLGSAADSLGGAADGEKRDETQARE